MSKIEVDAIEPQSGTSLTIGASGDTVTVPSGVTFDASNATTTLPSTVVTTTGTQTLTNKTINASQLTGTITPSDNTVTNTKIVNSTIQLAKLSATGTPSASTFLRGDNSWGAVSSDFVKLGDFSWSAITETSIDGYFSSTYNTYKLFINATGTSSGDWFTINANSGGTKQTGDHYSIINYSYVTSSASGTGVNAYWNNTNGYVARQSASSVKISSIELTIHNPLNTSQRKNMHSSVVDWEGSSSIQVTHTTNIWDVNSAMSGITLGVNAGNMTGTATLYGLK